MADNDTLEQEYYTAVQASRVLGVHRRSVYRYICEGSLRQLNIRGRRLIPREDLERCMQGFYVSTVSPDGEKYDPDFVRLATNAMNDGLVRRGPSTSNVRRFCKTLSNWCKSNHLILDVRTCGGSVFWQILALSDDVPETPHKEDYDMELIDTEELEVCL